ncbi:MAG: Rab family GTPase [Promethearchaeota archaeon]
MIVNFKFKVIVVGEPTVGKTTLIRKYTEKKFGALYIPTVGVQVSIKQIPFKIEKFNEKCLVELNIWDIAGHMRFQKIRKIFYEGANAFLLLYDVTNKKTFDGITHYIEDLKGIIGNICGILIGNKIDFKKERIISEEDGRKKAESLRLDFIETSAKTGANLDYVFELITTNILSQVKD